MGAGRADFDLKRAVLELVRERGPIGWYGMELHLRIPRTFKEGYTLMTYLEELVSDGSVERVIVDGQERFVAVDHSC